MGRGGAYAFMRVYIPPVLYIEMGGMLLLDYYNLTNFSRKLLLKKAYSIYKLYKGSLQVFVR
mgnify:CR=1 FL=1